MKKLKKFIFTIVVLFISLVMISACSSHGEFCFFGTVKMIAPDHDNTYWKSVDKKTSKKETKRFIEKCDQEVKVAKDMLFKIFVQLCTDGHISEEYLPHAIKIQHSYLEDYYLGENKENKQLIGTTDEIFKKYLASTPDRLPSIERLDKACALYIPQNGILYDYQIGPYLLFYERYYFEQCMTNYHFEKIVPQKTYRECKGIGW